MIDGDKGRIHKGRKERREKRSEENKNSDVAKTIEPDRTIDQIPDAARANECFERVTDEPAKDHHGGNVALQLRRQMRWKCGQQYHPPNTHRRQKKRCQQDRVGRPKN